MADAAIEAIEVYAPLWLEGDCASCPAPVGYGGHDAEGRAALRSAVTTKIAAPLVELGVVLDAARLEALLR